MHEIIIEVRGGVVQAVHCNFSDRVPVVHVLDYDNHDDREPAWADRVNIAKLASGTFHPIPA
jgi:hypothetical protein